MDYAHWIWLFIYGSFIIGTMITVLMDNRQPAKTLAWLLVLTFLPVVGLVLYIFFGQNYRKQKRIVRNERRELQNADIHGDTHHAAAVLELMPEEHRRLAKQFSNQSMSIPYPDNKVELFTSGYEFFPALLQAFSQARSYICLSTYIIANDALGRLITDALADRVKAGVEVRLIYDDVGCWKVHNSFFRSMQKAGIQVEAFMPVHFPALTGKINYRNHRKVCVIDGHTAFIGGMNIAMRYVKAWRDTHLRIEGPVVRAMEENLKGQSSQQHLDESSLPSNVETGSGTVLAQYVTSSPFSPWLDIMQGYVRILLEARQYVYMESPYFLPTEPILFAMRTAALAGVDVRLMVPRHSDAILVEWASISYVSQAIADGVQVYLYQNGFNHSKLLVCDDSLSTCGSTNIDFRSFENNFEANIFFYDRDMALRMKQVFLSDIRHCTLANEHYSNHLGDNTNTRRRRPFVRRLWESIVRLLAPLL